MTQTWDRTLSAARRASFARHARAALEKYLPQSRATSARWGSGANLAWVRWRREDGACVYAALRRHLDWVTAEVGLSATPREYRELPPHATRPGAEVAAFRLRLGEILHEEDRWWPAGATEFELVERLEWLALQLAVKGVAALRRHPGGVG